MGYLMQKNISIMATEIPINTGNTDLDDKINEWLKWNKVLI